MLYHGSGSLSDLDVYVRKTVETLKPFKSRFDSIVVTGMSGVILGSPVALRLHKPLVVLRKEGDSDNHSYSNWINIENAGARYIILDDFIASGRTFHRMREHTDYEGITYVGAYMYGDDILSWDGDGNIEWHPERKNDGRCWGIATQRSKRTIEPVKEREGIGNPVNEDSTYSIMPEFEAIEPFKITAEDESLARLKALLCGDNYEAAFKSDVPDVEPEPTPLAETMAKRDLDFSHYTANLKRRAERVAYDEGEPEPPSLNQQIYEEERAAEVEAARQQTTKVKYRGQDLADWAARQVAAYRELGNLPEITTDDEALCERIDAGEMWRNVETEREAQIAAEQAMALDLSAPNAGELWLKGIQAIEAESESESNEAP